MAVVAAVIAATVAWRQLAHAKKQQREDRWWETLTWVFDRSVESPSGPETLPGGVALTMLQALVDSAAEDGPTSLRKRAVGSILTMFTLPSEEMAGQDFSEAGGTVPNNASGTGQVLIEEFDADLLNSLRTSVEDSSPAVAAAVFEAKVYESLMRLVASHDGWHVARNPVVPRGRPDFLLRTPSRSVVIETKYARKSITAATAAGWVGHLRKYVEGLGPHARGILLCSQPLAESGMAYWSADVPAELQQIYWPGVRDDLAAKVEAAIEALN